MKVNKLAQVIRKIVREEVQKEVRNILAEQTTQLQNHVPNKKSVKLQSNKTQYTDNTILNEALNATETAEYPTMKTFNSTDAKAGFAAMQGGANQPPIQQDVNGRPVDIKKLDGGLDKALTRDYTDLVKRFKK